MDAAEACPDRPLECDLTEADDDEADGSYGLYWYLACRLDDVVSVRNFCGMMRFYDVVLTTHANQISTVLPYTSNNRIRAKVAAISLGSKQSPW